MVHTIAPASERLEVLDTFRALAIAGVLAFHFFWVLAPPAYAHDLYGYTRTYPRLLSLGQLGVQFFFMISGFVIILTLERCRSLPEFLLRRFARLYPAYLAVLLASYLVTNKFGPRDFASSPSDLVFGALMVPPGLGGGHFVDLAFWSLIVEAQFYLCIGVIYLVARRQFVGAWVALVAVGTACWLLGAVQPLHALTAVRHPLLLVPYLAYFTAGMAFYMLHQRRMGSWWQLMAAAVLAYLVVNSPGSWSQHAASAAMAAAFLLFIAGKLTVLAVPPLLFLGEISYSLYLLHQNLGVGLIGRLTRSGVSDLLAAGAAASACIALAWGITRLVEVPAKVALLRWARSHLLVRLSALSFDSSSPPRRPT